MQVTHHGQATVFECSNMSMDLGSLHIDEVVGLLTRKHLNWLDKADTEIQELFERNHSCHNSLLAKKKM